MSLPKKQIKESKWSYLHPDKPQEPVVKPKGLKKVSNKRAESERKKIQSYKEYDTRMQFEGKMFCTGCHEPNNLSHSHILSEAWCRKNGREELIWDSNNYSYQCLSVSKIGCHSIYEGRDIGKMLKLKDFWQRMEYIKSISETEYNKMMNRVDEYKSK